MFLRCGMRVAVIGFLSLRWVWRLVEGGGDERIVMWSLVGLLELVGWVLWRGFWN